MPEVPGPQYQPYFTGEAPERRVPLREVNAPPAAFGADIGRAINLFGEKLEGAGKEVFDRAVDLRRMEIESGVRDAVTQHYNDLAPDQQKFLSSQGANANQAKMNDLLANFDQRRITARDAVGKQYGVYGQKLFDDQAASLQRSFTRSAISHSADETRKVHDQSIEAAILTKQDQLRLTPTDAAAYKTGVDDLKKLVQDQKDLWGWDDTIADYKTKKAISGLTASRIDGMVGKGQVDEAADMFMKERDAGTLRGADIDASQRKLQAGINNVKSHQIYEDLRSGHGMELGKGVVSPERAREAIASVEEDQRGYMSIGPKVKGGDYALGRYQVMKSNLSSWLKEAGMPDMDVKAFLKSKEAQDQLFDFKFGQMQKRHGSFNDAASEWFTGKPLSEISPDRTDGYHTVMEYIKGANKRLLQGAPQEEISKVVRDRAEKYTGIDPDAPGIQDDKVRDLLHRDNLRNNADLVGLRQRFADLLNKGHIYDMTDVQSDPEGSAILEEARHIPQGQQWVNSLARDVRVHVANDNTPSPERDKNFYRLMGMSNDLDRQKDFAGVDAYRQDLTALQRQEVIRRQREVMSGKYDPVKVKAAMHDLDMELRNNGIRRSDTDTAANDKYMMFQGMFARKLEELAAANQPIPHEQTKLLELARPLLKEVGGSWWPPTFSHPYFQPPSAVAAALNEQFRKDWKVDRDMYPEEMGRAFENALHLPEWRDRIKVMLGDKAKDYVTE